MFGVIVSCRCVCSVGMLLIVHNVDRVTLDLTRQAVAGGGVDAALILLCFYGGNSVSTRYLAFMCVMQQYE